MHEKFNYIMVNGILQSFEGDCYPFVNKSWL